VSANYLKCYDLLANALQEKRRPQSLVVLPWTMTDPPFVTRSPTLWRSRSLPELSRRELPDQTAAADPEENEPDETESDPCTQELLKRPVESIRELDSLTKMRDQPEISIPDDDLDSVVMQAKQTEQAVLSKTENKAITMLEIDEGLAGEIGLAHTSDVLVESPGSLSPRIRPDAESKDENQSQQGEPTNVAPIPAGYHSEGSWGMDLTYPIGSVESPGDRSPDIVAQAKDSRDEVGDTTGEDCWPMATSRKGSSSEPSGLPSANLVGNENSLHSQKGSSASSKHSQHSQRSEGKLGQFPLAQPSSSSSISISSERANGVRVWTPPTTPDKSHRSSSFSKAQRPIYTSGSTTSQSSAKFKTLVSWPVGSAGHSKVLESDDESRSSLHSEEQSRRLADMDERERSFEELISRTDTIHCTITPDPIRRIEVCLAYPSCGFRDLLITVGFRDHHAPRLKQLT
jgi:hypothetical protein